LGLGQFCDLCVGAVQGFRERPHLFAQFRNLLFSTLLGLGQFCHLCVGAVLGFRERPHLFAQFRNLLFSALLGLGQHLDLGRTFPLGGDDLGKRYPYCLDICRQRRKSLTKQSKAHPFAQLRRFEYHLYQVIIIFTGESHSNLSP
jgi:hypothetical protein